MKCRRLRHFFFFCIVLRVAIPAHFWLTVFFSSEGVKDVSEYDGMCGPRFRVTCFFISIHLAI